MNFTMNSVTNNYRQTLFGLGTKFILLTIGILSVTLGFATLLNTQSKNDLIQRHLLEKGRLLGHFTARISTEAILAENFTLLNEYMKEVSTQNDVVYSVIINTNNQPKTTYLDKYNNIINNTIKRLKTDNIMEVINFLKKSDSTMHMEFPLYRKNNHIGTILLGISGEQIALLEQRNLVGQIIQYAIIIVFLSLCLYFVFRQNVLKPINLLIQGANRVTAHKFNQVVPVLARNELGNLALVFNRMMRHLDSTLSEKDSAVQQLTDLNKTLEDRVQKRTLELSRSEAHAKAILDHIGEGIITINERGFIESLNPSAEKIFGYDHGEAIGLHTTLLLGDEYGDQIFEIDNYKDLQNGPFAPDKTQQITGFNGKQKNSSVFPFEALITQVQIDDQQMRVCIIRDVSRRKQFEDELRRQSDKALAANRAKSTFLANMSHEIRSPLTAIIGFSEHLLDRNLGMSDRISSINTIIRSSKHLLQVINDILDLSKIEAEKLEVEHLPVELLSILDDVNALATTQAQSKGIDFNVNIAFPIPTIISSDPVRLKQILLNLTNNAIKFTEEGHVRIQVRHDPKKQLMFFDVIDTGIGLSPMQQQNLFNAFSQGDLSTTRKYGSTGLGLHISHLLAEKLGGTITVESTASVGSIFTTSIKTGPLDKVKFINELPQNLEKNANHNSPNYSIRYCGNVLLVEDNKDNQQLISLYLRKLGATVTFAENGIEAIEKTLADNFDLVLMDMQMPVMDGLEATKKLRDKNYARPIVALTANAMQTDIDQCITAGCDAYLSKPVDRELFNDVVSGYLATDNRVTVEKEPILSTLIDEDPSLAQLVNKFIDRMPCYLDEISKALFQKNWKSLEDNIHNFKSVSGSYGFPQLSDIAAKTEFEILKKDFYSVETCVQEMKSISKRILLADDQYYNEELADDQCCDADLEIKSAS